MACRVHWQREMRLNSSILILSFAACTTQALPPEAETKGLHRFLAGNGRFACVGDATVRSLEGEVLRRTDGQTATRAGEKTQVVLPTREFKLTCGESERPVNCPEGTNLIELDHRGVRLLVDCYRHPNLEFRGMCNEWNTYSHCGKSNTWSGQCCHGRWSNNRCWDSQCEPEPAPAETTVEGFVEVPCSGTLQILDAQGVPHRGTAYNPFHADDVTSQFVTGPGVVRNLPSTDETDEALTDHVTLFPTMSETITMQCRGGDHDFDTELRCVEGARTIRVERLNTGPASGPRGTPSPLVKSDRMLPARVYCLGSEQSPRISTVFAQRGKAHLTFVISAVEVERA